MPHPERQGTSSDKEYIFTMITSFSTSSYAIHADAFTTNIYIANIFENIINTSIIRFYRNFTATTMDTTDYWSMAREYSIWNAIIFSLQFWTEDPNPVTFGRATEHVYTIFFYSSMSHTLCQQPDETLFGCFVIALIAAFNQQLSLADEGYKSGSDAIDLPTPLQKTPCIHHISSMEHASFNPVFTTPCSTPQTPTRPLCRCLYFSSADHYTLDSTPVCSDSSDDEEEEDFPTVPLDDEHWTSEEMPERNLCIHEHGLPHGLCQYQCPYANYDTVSYMDSLDLSDISDSEDYMVTSSDEEILGMEAVPY